MLRTRPIVCLLAGLSLLAAITLNSRAHGPVAEIASPVKDSPLQHRPPLDFVENRGQWDRRINFIARQGDETALVEQATLTLHVGTDRPTTVSLRFEGASTRAVAAGEGKSDSRYNFYFGKDSSNWHSDVPAYRAVVYRRT